MQLSGKKRKLAINNLIGYFLHPKKKIMIVLQFGFPNQSRVSDSNSVKSIYGQWWQVKKTMVIWRSKKAHVICLGRKGKRWSDGELFFPPWCLLMHLLKTRRGRRAAPHHLLYGSGRRYGAPAIGLGAQEMQASGAESRQWNHQHGSSASSHFSDPNNLQSRERAKEQAQKLV